MFRQNIYVTVDAVVFGRIDQQLHILLVKRGHDPFKDMWALPGGFVEHDEDLEPAAIRELYEETNIQLKQMQLLFAVGTPGRDPRMRTISIVYTAEINSSEHMVKGGDDAKEAGWWNTNNLPPLAFDHKKIIEHALAHRSAH
jgi:8-oxo-dGTP diphosphatase